MGQIKDKILLFVKRDPGMNLSQTEVHKVIRTLERDQRVRLRQENITGFVNRI